MAAGPADNQYLEECQPWKLAKDPEKAAELDRSLWSAAEGTRIAGLLLAPYIPATSNRIMEQLGLPALQDGDWRSLGDWGAVEYDRVGQAVPLFPRIEVDDLSS